MSRGQIHLETYIEGESILHQIDARLKFITLVIFLVIVNLLPNGALAFYILLGALLSGGILASGISKRLLIKRAAILEVPFLFILLPLLFFDTGIPIVMIGISQHVLTITSFGLTNFFSVLIKVFLSVQASVLISSTTRFQDLLSGMRNLGLPRLITAVLGMMWRYLFVIVSEAQRMLTARKARSSKLSEWHLNSGGALPWRAKVAGGMAGSLFLRSIERSERIYDAMKSRGYDGESRMPGVQKLSINQHVLIAGILAFGILLLLTAYQIY